MSSRNTIAKNASVLMISQALTWAMSLVLMLFLPRFLGAEGMGQLHLSMSIWAIVGMFITFGTDTLLTKEISRTPEKTAELVGAAIILRSVFYVVGFGLTAVAIQFAGYSQETIYVIYIIGLAELLNQVGSVARASLIGLERMEYVAIASIAFRAFVTVVSIAILLLGYGVLVAAAVNIGGTLITAVLHFYYLQKLQPVSFLSNWDTLKVVFKASSPYLMVYAFSVIYKQLDAVIISLLINETQVGWYGVADQLFGTFMFVPTVFITAVFPALSRMFADKSDSLIHLMRKSFHLLLLLSVPIGLGVTAIASPLVVLLFGSDFAPSGPVLAIMGFVLVLTYQNILLGQFLISTDRQNAWTVVMAVATIATIPLDMVLVPWCQAQFGNGAIGGSLAYIFTEGLMVVAGLWLLPAGALDKTNIWLSIRVLLAGLVMLAVVWTIRDLPIVVPIAVGGVVYIGLITLLRVVPEEDWAVLRTAGQKIFSRFRKHQSEPASL